MYSNNELYQEIISANAKYKEHVSVAYYDGINIIKLKNHEVYLISNIIYENLKYVNQEAICFGLLMDHNIYIPSFIISIQKLNCAFMFLDAKQPLDVFSNIAIHYILEYNSQPSIKNADLLFSISLNLNEICNVYQVKNTLKIYKNINYVIKTSGTTKMQKDVVVEHQCIASNIFSLRKKLVISEKDIIYFGTSLTFDPSIVELYLGLITGACLFIVSKKIKQNPQLLYKVLFLEDIVQITFLQICPSVLMRWNLENVQNIFQKTKLRILLLGGENFPIALQTIEKSRELRIFNIYGITEISCWAMIAEITPNQEITLGEVLDDTFVEVRSIDGEIITEGEGELFIGSFKRICYVDDEDPEVLKKPVIRATGDRVIIKNNKIIYKGRTNDIIKRFGHRVDTQLIENLVYEETNLRNVCIWLPNEYKLVLFVLIPNSNKDNDTKIIDKLRVKLLHTLPKECIPDHIELLEEIPLTINGKVDKRKLSQKANTIVGRCNISTLHLLEIFEQLWCKYFGNKTEITDNATFYELGGTSILAMQFSEEFRQKYESILPAAIFDYIFTNKYNDVRIFLGNFENKRRKRNISDGIDSTNKMLKQNQQLSMKIKWKYDLQACVDTTPVAAPNKSFIAVGSFSNIFSILNSDTGAEVRKIIFPNAIESPCLISKCENFIYVGCFDHKMYCIEVCTGNTIWAYETGDYIKNRPCFLDQDSAIIFGSYDRYLYCVNAKTGLLRWKLYIDGGITSDALLVNSIIITVTIKGMCVCLKENGSMIWRIQLDNPVFSSPTMLFKNQFVLPDVLGTLYCLNCNGEKLWEYKTTGNIYSSVCFHENLLIFGSHNGVIYCLEYKEEDLKPSSKHQIVINSATSSTVSILIKNSKTYIVTACVTGYVYLIDISNFSIESSLKLDGGIFSSPIVIQNNIFIGCRDNNLICIEVH